MLFHPGEAPEERKGGEKRGGEKRGEGRRREERREVQRGFSCSMARAQNESPRQGVSARVSACVRRLRRLWRRLQSGYNLPFIPILSQRRLLLSVCLNGLTITASLCSPSLPASITCLPHSHPLSSDPRQATRG